MFCLLTKVVSCELGHSEWTICRLLSLFGSIIYLQPWFSKSSSSSRPDNENHFHPNGMRSSDISAQGIRIEPFASC